MKRRLVILLALTTLAIGSWLGAVQAKPTAPGVNVGVLFSASGPLYFAGAFQRAGCELAKREVSISCRYADAGDTDAEAKLALRQLRSNDVDVVLTPIETESVRRIVKFNLQDPLPLIAPSAVGEGITSTASGKNWLFRISSTSTQDASVLAEYLAKDKPGSVAILVGPETYSKQYAKLLQFGLVIRGITGIHSYSIEDLKEARSTDPEVVVLVSMESSIQFLAGLTGWFEDVPKKFLVQGNLANYSMYSWAGQLQSAKALIPSDQVDAEFSEEVAKYLRRPNLLTESNQAMLALAWRTYKAALLAAGLSGDRRLALERMKQVFSPSGYYLNQKYSIYGYRSNGTFTLVGSYQPDTP